MPNSIIHKEFDAKRRFGVELEIGDEIKKKAVQSAIVHISPHKVFMSKYALTSNNTYWHVKDDATCGRNGRHGPKGVEIASFVGRGLNDLNHISQTATHLSSIGCKTNPNCGLHIHADVCDLNVNQVSVITAHWIKLEFVISLLLPIRRMQNEYCKFIFSPFSDVTTKNNLTIRRDYKYRVEDFWQKIVPSNLNIYDNNERRYNLNLVNFARAVEINSDHRKTLELRWPEGTLDSIEISNWVVFFLNLIEACKDKTMPNNLQPYSLQELLELLGIRQKKNKFVILGKMLHDMKTWICERIIKNDVDSSQFYAHFSTIGFQQDCVCEAKKILEQMWSPIKISS